MKTLIRFAVAGALMAGFATAQAQNLPSSGNSDLWVFVSDATAKTTFAEDTGLSLSSLLPTASLVSGANLNTSIAASFSVAATSTLTNYINAANSAGHTLTWAVYGAQFPGSISGSGYRKPGGFISIFDDLGAVGSNIAQGLLQPTLQNIGTGIEGDLTYLKASYTAGGKVYNWLDGSTAGNVWGPTTGGNGGSTDLSGQEFDQAGIALGTTNTLYGLTGNSGPGQVQSYILGTDITVAADGTLKVGYTGGNPGGPSVPLPAAVWLLGSGLLGLFGVGRRRAAAV
jgi:hypothetical protein